MANIRRAVPLMASLLLLAAMGLAVCSAEETHKPLCVHVFVDADCPQCDNVTTFLKALEQKYDVVIRQYNVTNTSDQELYNKTKDVYGFEFCCFPIAFISEKYFIGERSIKENIEAEIQRCLRESCPCPIEKMRGMTPYIPRPGEYKPETLASVTLPVFGAEFDVSLGMPLFLLAIILGLVDGFNPCTLAVLMFLIAYLLNLGSRRKVITLGLTFVAVVYVVYFLFMLGLLNILAIITYLSTVKMIIALVVLFAGAVMLKDFFFYGQWFSLRIPEVAKPTIGKLAKQATIPSAIVLAVFSSLVELPCTAGFPLIYTTILVSNNITGNLATAYIFWYNIFYVIPLLVLVGLIYWADLKAEEAEEWRLRTRKYMRLMAGSIMLVLGAALLLGWM